MSGGSATSWARLRLVQGESTAQGWELVGSLGQTTFSVGSGNQSTWRVRAEDVQPVHFTLHWDGSTLRVADLGNHGDVRADGVRVGSAWHTLVGHVRLEFGRAAMMVDTSALRASESDHPLEPGSAPPEGFADPASGAMPRLHKATLLGVASVDAGAVGSSAPAAGSSAPPAAVAGSSAPPAAVAGSSAPPAASASSAPVRDLPSPVPGASDGFRVSRFSDSERVRKSTLLGAAVSVPPDAPLPSDAPQRSTPSRGLSTATLMGVVGPLDARLARPPADAKTGDVRTIVGMPMTDATIRNALGVAATQTELQPVSGPPPERIASTWQEDAGSDHPSLAPDTLRDVVAPLDGSRYVDPARIVSPAHGSARPIAGGRPNAGALDAQRPAPGSASASPKRAFPLQYIGIVMLTCAAYFAWLYLLDHW